MALIRTGGGANVVTTAELTLTNLSESTGNNTYHKASANSGYVGYNRAAIINSSAFSTFGPGGAGTGAGSITISINEVNGDITVEVATGFIVNGYPKITFALWKE